MKKKALIKVLAAQEDLEKLSGVFAHLRSNGVVVSAEKDSFGKKDIVLVVLTERFYSDETLKSRLFDQLAMGAETILPLNLAGVPVPDEIMHLLFARNIITPSGRSDEQLAERILSAIPEKKNHMTAVLSVAVVALLLVSGVFIWRSVSQQKEAAVQAEEEPIPNPLGITEEELAEIKDVVIIGDSFAYFDYDGYDEYGHWPEIQDFAYETQEEDAIHWYSTEDGHEFTMTRYEDLRFLSLMPNLTKISMVLVDVDPEMLPDLSNSTELASVSIRNCSMTDISWIAGSFVNTLDITGTNIADYSPLSQCSYLNTATIDGQGRYHGDLSGFAPPSIFELNLYGMDAREDLTALSACSSLSFMRLENLQIQNLDFLKGMDSLRTLEMRNLPQLRDISGVAELADLRGLYFERCDGVRDYTPIHACSKLERIHINRWNWINADSSFLKGLTKLRDIDLFGLNLNNMDFLESVDTTLGVHLGFCGDIQDYSGLSHVKNFRWIHVNPRTDGGRYGNFALVAPHLQNAVIAEMELYNCVNADLSQLPNVTQRLTITGGLYEDLTGLEDLSISCLELKDMQYLRSLKGIEALPKLSNGMLELRIMGCVRLTDYAPLDGASMRMLHLVGMYNLPDFGKFTLKNLQLESIEDMEDLKCLENLDKNLLYQFGFTGLDDLKDLSVLREFRGTNLLVPPQVADQAEELVQSGNFFDYRVSYPESGWSPMDEEVTLLSMEELETLPKAVLRRVSRVWIAGDEIIDPNRYEVWEQWDGSRPYAALHDRQTNENRKLSMGSIHDFSRLSELTNLRELRLFVQPITSLEGIQNLSNLACFEAMCCTNLQDVSALYTLQNLEEIGFQLSSVDSIQGVQNLPRLRCLNIASTDVTDLSPLQECDLTHVQETGGFILVASNTFLDDLSPIAGIPSFMHLNVCGYAPEYWMQYVEGSAIFGYCGPLGSDALLQEFVRQHPELQDLNIEAGYQLTDLTPLLELQDLNYVHIWDRADDAVRSLDGHGRQFQLDVD